jgi:hypothetical protein
MYGTVAKMDVLPGKREELKAVADRQMADPIAGYVKSYVLFEDDSDVMWLMVQFEDKDSYVANADDPSQHERYMEIRALLTADPEWHDGKIEEG